MRINLLPWRERLTARKIRQYGLMLLITIIFIISANAVLYVYLKSLKAKYQLRHLHLAQIMATHSKIDDEQLIENYKALKQQVMLIQMVGRNNSDFWRVLTFLQQRLPKTIQLSELNWDTQSLHLQGQATGAESIHTLVKLLENLDGQILSSVTVLKITPGKTEHFMGFFLQAQRWKPISA